MIDPNRPSRVYCPCGRTIRELTGLINTTSLQRAHPLQRTGLSNTLPQTISEPECPVKATKRPGACANQDGSLCDAGVFTNSLQTFYGVFDIVQTADCDFSIILCARREMAHPPNRRRKIQTGPMQLTRQGRSCVQWCCWPSLSKNGRAYVRKEIR